MNLYRKLVPLEQILMDKLYRKVQTFKKCWRRRKESPNLEGMFEVQPHTKCYFNLSIIEDIFMTTL